MTELEQLAEAQKYSSALVWHFAEIRPDVFALYDFARRVHTIGTWEEVQAAYRARPEYRPIPRVPTKNATHNILKSSIKINI